jgi:hypothetical protein
MTVAGMASGGATNVTVNAATLYADHTFAREDVSLSDGANAFAAVAADASGCSAINTVTSRFQTAADPPNARRMESSSTPADNPLNTRCGMGLRLAWRCGALLALGLAAAGCGSLFHSRPHSPIFGYDVPMKIVNADILEAIFRYQFTIVINKPGYMEIRTSYFSLPASAGGEPSEDSLRRFRDTVPLRMSHPALERLEDTLKREPGTAHELAASGFRHRSSPSAPTSSTGETQRARGGTRVGPAAIESELDCGGATVV